MIRELTWQNLLPELVVDDGPSRLSCGKCISLRLSQERHCVGYKEFGASSYVACPSGSTIFSGKDPQCQFCQQRDVSFTAKTGYGLSKQAGELLSSDHAVYLAYFANGTVKVGVALWDRKEVRVSEQGAVACLFIAKGNGTAARNFERQIHNKVGLTESVRLETKLKILENEPNEKQVQVALSDAYSKVKRETPSSLLFNEPDYIYLFPRYTIQQSVFNSPIRLVQQVCGGTSIFGTLVGVYGKVILIQVDGETYAMNSQLICGFDVRENASQDLNEMLGGLTTKRVAMNRQQSLLDLF